MAYSYKREPGEPVTMDDSKRSKMMKPIATLIVVLIIIVGGIYLLRSFSPFSSVKDYYDSNWQAVFLSNGQVYFGKISGIDDDFLYLKNIYYLQVITEQKTALG